MCPGCLQYKKKLALQKQIIHCLTGTLNSIYERWESNYKEGCGFPVNAGSLAWAMADDAKRAISFTPNYEDHDRC